MIYQIVSLNRFSRIGVSTLFLICGTALSGWVLGIPGLASIVPGWPRMALIVVLGFVLSGAAVLELTRPVASRALGLARIAAAGIVLAIGAATLVDFMARGGLIAPGPGPIYLLGLPLGRPSPATAFNFLVAAAALMVPRGDRWGRVYSGLVATGLAVTAFDFAGYVYDIAALSRGPTISTMSLPTMTSFVLLFVSMLLARPQVGWAAIVFGNNSTGIIARRFLPTVLILPFVVNGVLILVYRSRPFEALFGFAILAVVTAIGLAVVTLVIAAWLGRHEDQGQRKQDILDAIAEGSMAVIYVKDLAGRYLLVNRRYLDIFGMDRQAVIGKTDYEIFSGERAAAFRDGDEKVIAVDHELIVEEVMPLPDGVHTYVSAKAPLRNAAGELVGVFGIATDITDRKRGEEALAASDERTRLIVETALDAVVGIDQGGAITDWNRQSEAIFGWTRKEVLGRQVEDMIMPQRFREGHRRGLARYLETGEARVLGRRIELAGLHRDGREFPVELSITAMRSGRSAGFTAFVRDITDRKEADARLQSQLQRLGLLERITRAVGQRQDMRSIFQTVVRTLEDRLPADFVCICSYDAARQELSVSHVGASSAARGRALGIVEQAVIPVDQNGLSRCLGGALVYEPDIAQTDFPFPRRLAGQGLRSLVITPLMIEAKVFGMLLVARLQPNAFVSADCEFLNQLGEHVALAAHQVQLRQGLEEAYEDLKRTQQTILQQERLRALGQMASGIAHDINNAISPVAVYTQSLLEREPNLSPRTLSYLETVGRVIKDVSATVSRMRDFYRRGDADDELEPTDLNTLIPQVVELTKARWSDMPQRRGIVIQTVTRLEEILPLVMANAVEIREAVTNLIFNAVDAMPQGGILSIRTSSASGRVRLEVEDSGVGMDEDTRRRSLEPFFTTKGERGTGLGLALVYGTAQRHKAALDIDSTPGKGTRVTLEFAVTETKAQPPRSVTVSKIPPLRVLLVDDDPFVLESTQLVLELDGHAVVAVDGGQAGMDALQAAKDAGAPFDVLVTDLGMPYVDGNQVARAAREISPSTTIVLLTGWGRKMGDDGGQAANIDHVLPKPLDLDELRSVFARHLDGSYG